MKKSEAVRLAAWLNMAPKVLRIGAYDHHLEIVDGWLKNDKGENCWGHFQPAKRLISIAVPEQASQPIEIASTLLHEILHAIWYERELGSKAKEEEGVRNIEAGLMLLFRQNPQFMKWFLEIF